MMPLEDWQLGAYPSEDLNLKSVIRNRKKCGVCGVDAPTLMLPIIGKWVI